MKRFLNIFLAICLVGCAQPSDEIIPVATELDKLMSEQQASWNAGDLDGFMKHYWNNDSLIFIGKKGPTYGWNGTLENYKKSYPDRAAMGRLKFTNLHNETLSNSSAYIIGKWELFRTLDTLAGHYTLLWHKIDGKWVIVADHSS
jgi:ketosteroid isomerase-like protein